MSRLSYWTTILLALIAGMSLVYGSYEFAVHGTELTAEQVQIRMFWIAAASASLFAMTSLRLANREWRRLIAGLDTSDLPDEDELIDLENNHISDPEAVWIIDMTGGFLNSGFCHDPGERASNIVGLTSSVVSAGLLGFALFNPVSGLPAILGIATGSIGVGTLLKDLFSYSRFEYWEETGTRIAKKWHYFTSAASASTFESPSKNEGR
jgi:hypothetical protein